MAATCYCHGCSLLQQRPLICCSAAAVDFQEKAKKKDWRGRQNVKASLKVFITGWTKLLATNNNTVAFYTSKIKAC